MKTLLKQFEEKRPEIIFEWNDHETEARGWVVINSLRGGAAGGGTRMRVGLDQREVEALAKTMEVKFTISGPPIGGAKSGINFDPNDPRKEDVLKRWFESVHPLLKNYYGTGGDLNVDEIEEVIPITETYGIWHPQEGIVNGHFHPAKPKKIHMIGRLRQGVSKILEDPEFYPNGDKRYTVADMITGYGVASSVEHYYKIWKGDLTTKRAIVQGWGNVGATAALYLAKSGVKIVGIIDKYGGLINPEGYQLEDIKSLFFRRKGNKLVADDMIPFEEINKRIWSLGAEVFIPAAASKLISLEQMQALIAHDLEVVACGANVPFKDEEFLFGPIADYVDDRVALIPDFLANCGMARVFAYLMEGEGREELTDHAIFMDTSHRIETALSKVYERNTNRHGIAKTALEIALKQLL